MQKPRDSFANHLSVNLQAQKPHRHPWDNHHSSGSDTAAEEGDLAVMDVALRPLLSSTATTATPSSTPPGHSSSTARLTRPIGTTAFNNYRQHLKKLGPYEVHCEVLDNRQGKIIVDGALTIYCGQLQSTNGMIAATGPIHIVCHEFCNSNGVVQSHIGTITITSRYALCNQQGQLLAQSDITLTHPHARFDNRQGSIISQGSLHITGDTLTNQGQITGETIGMTLKEQLINGPVGAIQAAKKLDVITSHDCRNEGQMQAGNQLTIQSHEFLNHNDGQLQAPQLKLTVDTYLRNRGTIEAKEMQLQAHTLSNFFKHDRPGAGQLRAENNLTLNDCYECYNEGEITAGQRISFQSHIIHNHQAGKFQASTLELSGGEKEGGNVTNHGLMEMRQGLLRGNHVYNNGVIQSEAGQVPAGNQLAIQSHTFLNYIDGQLQAPQLKLTIDTYLTNRGTIEADQMQLSAHTLSNVFKHERPGAGKLQAKRHLTISDGYECYNEGEIHAGEQLSLHARTIHNHKDGKIQAPTMDLIGGTEKRDDGSLWSGGDVTNHGSIELRSGLMRARTVFNGSNGQVYADDLRIEAT
ncbi:MAG: hypothetical protein AB2990_01920 [Candidatus Symbiodolus clandestinus]